METVIEHDRVTDEEKKYSLYDPNPCLNNMKRFVIFERSESTTLRAFPAPCPGLPN